MRRAVLSALGLGYLPLVPGTWASLATVALAWAVHGRALGPASPALLAAFAAGAVATLALGSRTALLEADADPSWVVTDEVAGQALALAVAFAAPQGDPLTTVVAAFVLFRVLDMAKPGPVAAAERLPGGMGILADDLVAGALAGGAVAAARAAGWL